MRNMPDIFNSVPEFESAFRLLLAAALGAVIGYGGQTAWKAEASKFFSLISLGASLFIVVSVFGPAQFIYFTSTTLKYTYDPSRVIAQIILGAGILIAGMAAGGVIKEGRYLFAAGLWTAFALGTAVGLGMYTLATVTAIAACAVPLVVDRLQTRNFLQRFNKEGLNKDEALKYE